MPIHYDTIEDGQNKKSHLLFSNKSERFHVEANFVIKTDFLFAKNQGPQSYFTEVYYSE